MGGCSLKDPICCVILTNYNGVERGFLNCCLDTISANLKKIKESSTSVRVVVIDDNSQDCSFDVLKKFQDCEEQDKVVLIHTQHIEATRALNFGMKYVLKQFPECQFILTLDHDTALDAYLFKYFLFEAQKADDRAGMFASNQYMLNEYPRLGTLRSRGHFIDKAGACKDRDFENRVSAQGKTILCPCLSGALYKTKMIEEIGPMSEKYLHYYNCPELGFRAQLNNWTVQYIPQAIMWHKTSIKRNGLNDTQLKNREISRIYNILRFFPEEKIKHTLDRYKQEQNVTSPPITDKLHFISEAKNSCPEPFLDERKKKAIYREYVKDN